MNFFRNLNKKSAAADLVQRGLANQDAVSAKQIRDCIFLLANGMGDTWKQANIESAAGMVLMMLAKNSALKTLLNACGWKLVLGMLQSYPRLERDLSMKLRGEIRAYQLNVVAVAA